MEGSNINYKGTIDAVRTMYKTEGLRSFYKGMIPNYMKVVPTIAISFVTYEHTKVLINDFFS